ncbi:Lrp/AsnC ligand binding domain-containing protein [Candidatus Nitrosotenuis aquarius]|jgi:DNA-binding Lrp family transcriptional regulator|uniref:Lrp/AsnC ligand binding domain-containing protein n=1 Tax=Candidatus Nitrosotenuis aquarius TaxID=1846278 RepID=UPI000C1E2E68|nr:Lrp/AsnC ligand binding domain-containing protein [Candidatus Nitrosotenuis aquarius]
MSYAYVLINCDLGSEERVLSELKSIKKIKETHGVFGAYDIVAKVEAPSDSMIKEVVTGKIRSIDRVRSTLTLWG